MEPAPSETASSGSIDVGTLASIQSQILGNADIMSAIMALRNDPVVQAAVTDSEVQRMIGSGDFTGLMAHPKIEALMRHDGIRAITSQITPQ